MIILDFGSGNSCKNDVNIVKRMIDELVKVDTRKHEVIIKWQLFNDAPPNTPLQYEVFDFAYWYAEQAGYQTTASVFDIDSLQYLLTYDIPFVKLANRPDLYWLAGEVPRKIPIVISVGEMFDVYDDDATMLYCISKYPAETMDYIGNFTVAALKQGISDHTTDFALYDVYQPKVYEVHYRLADSTGPDGGPFSRTPEQLAEIL